ncbi:hypothetical protein [Actinocorallia sp. A-T 12471]|uniref:hypothetical protein n=1 Tax=Actinocorallia sp. A-T 12471 TaxID=3089813 RepID=UPI0029CCC79D|nr:hypothetical protein [Actinocorallia sp. A-T 12471]MDX6740512.1 hypothetical protein [Actinocorallia sp. A-T 12471]
MSSPSVVSRACVAGLLALPLGLVGVAPAEAARRAATVEDVAVTPENPVLRDNRTTKLTARIRATGASSVTVDFGPQDGVKEKVDAVRLSTSGAVQQWEASVTLDRARATGLWDVRVNAWDGVSGTTVRTEQVYVRRETRIPRFDAGPEPAKRGGPLRLEGRLTRLDPLAAPDGMVKYANASVRLYFSADVQEPRRWTHVANATTDSLGRFTKTVKAHRTGYWRAAHSGTPHYAPTHSWPDHVRLR